MAGRPVRTWRMFRLSAAAVFVLAAWLGGAASAHGLTLDVPAQALRSVTATATLGASDPTGTVSLLVDGAVIRTGPVSSLGGSLAFSSVPLTQGSHTVLARLTDGSGGVTTSTAGTVYVWDRPGAPQLLRPSGGLVGGVADVVAQAGPSTSMLALRIDGIPAGSTACSPGQVLAMGYHGMSPGWHVITLVASNPFGEQAVAEWGFTRIDYPASTSIVIDKSDFRLYWVRDDILVKVYPIAHGKRRTPTPNAFWIVGRKEYMPPRGVYGPRRLKLARLSRYRGRTRWRMTGFGIHGTNEPWVIGTQASHGCIRLTNDMILELWPQVPQGTLVQTRQ